LRSVGLATEVIFIAAKGVLEVPVGRAKGPLDVDTEVAQRVDLIIAIGSVHAEPENESHNEAWGITVP